MKKEKVIIISLVSLFALVIGGFIAFQLFLYFSPEVKASPDACTVQNDLHVGGTLSFENIKITPLYLPLKYSGENSERGDCPWRYINNIGPRRNCFAVFGASGHWCDGYEVLGGECNYNKDTGDVSVVVYDADCDDKGPCRVSCQVYCFD